MSSIFDYLEPQEDPGGLSGLALNLHRQGGPKTIRQGFGQGLLNFSQVGQEALPQAIQGGFGPGFLAGFAGSLGAPARQTVAQEEERGQQRRQTQLAVLQQVFPKLSPAGKTQVLRKLGIDLELGEEPVEPTEAQKEMIDVLGNMIGDAKQDQRTREGALSVMKTLVPEMSDALGGLAFFAGGEDAIEPTASNLYDNYTTKSVTRFFDKSDKEYYGRFDRLEAKPDKGKERATTPGQELELQAISDYAEIQKMAQTQGIPEPDAVTAFFSDKAQERYANFQRTFGMSPGSAPPSELELQLRAMDILSRTGIAGPMKEAGQLVGEASNLLDKAGAEAKERAGKLGTIAFPGAKAGPRHPAGMGQQGGGVPPQAAPVPPSPFEAPGEKPSATLTPGAVPVPEAFLNSVEKLKGPAEVPAGAALFRAAAASGVDLGGNPTYTMLKARLQSLPPDVRLRVVNLAKQIMTEDENTPAAD